MKVTRQWLDSPEPTTRDDERREIEYNAFAAGRAAGLREAVAAIKTLFTYGDPDSDMQEHNAAIGIAIEKIKGLVPPKENFLRDQYKTMYEAGIAEGIRRCREAVEKKLSIYNDNEFGGAWEVNHGLKTALAAIDAVEGE